MLDASDTRRNFIFFFGTALGITVPALPLAAAEPSPAGRWKTIDDKTRQARGIMRLYEEGGAIFGKIEESFDPKDATDVCDKCTDDRKNKPIIGLLILKNMRRQTPTEYGGGEILDPDTGSIYRCKITVGDGGKKLTVRGFVGISMLGRSQVWLRDE